MKKLAIIPARGGGKRIPRKNIKPFFCKPIIGYSIEVALQAGIFNEVMVSSDDDEIVEVAKGYGATVSFLRNPSNADDYVTTMDVLQEVVEAYRQQNKVFDFICCVYPSAPLIQAKHLAGGYRLINSGEFNSVLPVVAFSYLLLHGLNREENGRTVIIWSENLNKRSQDLEEVYHDAGQWYWFKNSAIGEPIFEKSGSLVLNENEAQDIDNLCDWQIVEMKYERLQSS